MPAEQEVAPEVSEAEQRARKRRLWLAAAKPPMYSVAVVPILVSARAACSRSCKDAARLSQEQALAGRRGSRLRGHRRDVCGALRPAPAWVHAGCCMAQPEVRPRLPVRVRARCFSVH